MSKLNLNEETLKKINKMREMEKGFAKRISSMGRLIAIAEGSPSAHMHADFLELQRVELKGLESEFELGKTLMNLVETMQKEEGA